MTLQTGDKIVVESEKVTQPGREGIVEEVLHEDPPRVRVRWDDGHTSILTPSAGAARVIPGKTRKTRAKSSS
jgi:translation initiation factor IF-1